MVICNMISMFKICDRASMFYTSAAPGSSPNALSQISSQLGYEVFVVPSLRISLPPFYKDGQERFQNGDWVGHGKGEGLNQTIAQPTPKIVTLHLNPDGRCFSLDEK